MKIKKGNYQIPKLTFIKALGKGSFGKSRAEDHFLMQAVFTSVMITIGAARWPWKDQLKWAPRVQERLKIWTSSEASRTACKCSTCSTPEMKTLTWSSTLSSSFATTAWRVWFLTTHWATLRFLWRRLKIIQGKYSRGLSLCTTNT